MDERTDRPGGPDLLELPLPKPRECPFGPPPEMAGLRERTPVVRVKCPTGLTAWLVTRYADVREVLGDAERFSSRAGQAIHLMAHADPERPVGELEFSRMDGADYQRFRRTIGPEVSTAQRMTELRPMVQALVDERLDALAAAGPAADLYADFAVPVTTAVIGGLVGVPYADRELFHNAAAVMFSGATSRADVLEAMRPLHEYLFRMVATRRATPLDDSLTRMIARSEASERPYTDLELVGICAALLVPGFDTSATVMAHGLLTLLAHPAELARLHAEPSLVPSAVEEIVRFLGGAPGIVRQATRDTEIGGHPVAAGDYIVLAMQAADRDTEVFPDPDRLDVGRRPNNHLGFGHGTHQCFGQQTARLELTVTLQTLLRRVPSLRLAVPLEDVPFKTGSIVYGPAEVPVTWDAVLPAEPAG
ncbi:cytochrome P450 [Streptomyces sp. MAR4 CNX-425]|uniref:cytochrome P450 n=1 Tax=Streptomyces sp. MAR4 CNX-425 TaxID=3406343 RepID=UPI003B50A59E